MKIKPTHKPGGVLVELGPEESQIPVKAEQPSPAFKVKRLLVPVDFSDCSNKALQYALPFARQFGASLTLLYVIQPYVPVPETMAVDWDLISTRMREGGQAELDKLRQTLDPDIKAETVLRIGSPEVEIVNAAKELNIDLIILSTHGRTGLGHVFLGSTTERVVRHAGCPVLVVREREHEFVEADTKTNGAA
jgi:nucleotide-binding universal stress UspA family protein